MSRWNWTVRKDANLFHCNLSGNDVMYYFQGFQSIYQHSNKPKHVSLPNLRFGNNCRRFLTKDTTVSVDKTSPSSFENHRITFDLTLKEKVSTSEVVSMFKVAQDDLNLRACDGIPSLFQKTFPHLNVVKSLTMSIQKASYVLRDGFRSIATTMACYKN